MFRNRFLKMAAGLVLALGVTATTLWFLEISPDDWRRLWFEALLALLCTVGLTVGNLGIRWLRWHYVSRRLGFYVRVRDSYRIFAFTLPAIATPFYLGELVRGLLLRSRYPGAAPAIFITWVLERTADVVALLVILFGLGREYVLASVVFAVWFACVTVLASSRFGTAACLVARVRFTAVVVTLSVVAWSLPILGLWVTLHLIGTGLPLYSTAEAFVTGTLLGGVSGIPLGTGVTGSLTAVRLIASGVASDLAPLAVAVMRSGTAWFSLVLGLIAAYHLRGRVAGLSEPQTVAGHFDEIAEGYAGQITGHVRVRLLSRKISTMGDRLEAAGFDSSARGLDVGCGQGWYADEMTRLGYRIHGMDTALRQVEASPETTSASFLQGEASDLPFPEDAFDFAYGSM